MTAPVDVDVLAVLRDVKDKLGWPAHLRDLVQDDFENAIAAVAELIVADREVDETHATANAALADLRRLTHQLHVYGPGPENCRTRVHARAKSAAEDAAAKAIAASIRHAAALERVGGAK